MKKNNIKRIGQFVGTALVAVAAMVTVSRCGNTTGVVQTYVQIERLGRPAINEGLVLYNNELNAFNSIPPTMDLQTSNPVVAAVIGEASAVLTAIYTFSIGAGFSSATRPGDTVGGFLPDVLRIDTQAAGITVGKFAYNGDAVGSNGGTVGSDPAFLTGGRKIEDNAANITLSYLFTGSAGSNNPAVFNAAVAGAGYPVGDKLTYDMQAPASPGGACNAPGVTSSVNNPSAPGHTCLYQQATTYGSANFPYLAQPY